MPIERTCANCGQSFYCYPNEVEKGRIYCSLTCRSKHRFNKKLPAASRTPVNFICKECGKPFAMMQSYLTAYRKKFNKDPLYCSMNCSNIGRRKDADERNKFKCQHCGKEEHRSRKPGGRIYREQKYCSYECKVAAQKQAALTRFETKPLRKHLARNGYVRIRVPTLARTEQRDVFEHRYVMAKYLNRELYEGETVHHKDGNRQNNAIENLELFSSRHGPGQRVIDKVQFAIEILTLYPEFARAAGYELRKV